MKIRNKIKKNKHFKSIYLIYYLAFLLASLLACTLSAVLLNNTVPNVWYYAVGVFVISIFLCKFVTDLITIRVYKPIDEMIKYFDDSEKDVTFLNRSVKSLITENEQMKQRLEISGRYIENNQLRDIIYGNAIYRGDLPENANINVIVGKCFIVYIECDVDVTNKGDNSERKVTKLKKDCAKTVREYFEEKLTGKFVQLDDNKYAFLTKPVVKKKLTEYLIKLIDIIEDEYKIGAFAVVGKTVDGMSGISDSFMEIGDILERRFALGKALVFVEDFIHGDDSIYYPHDLETTLINSVIGGNNENAMECLSKIFEMNFIKRALDKKNIGELRFAMTATIKRIMRNIGAQTEDIFGEGSVIYLELSSVGSGRELMERIRKMVEKICDYQTKMSKETKSRIPNDIREYVRNNYKNNISILTMSESLFVSQSHINRIMRTEFGQSFKNYLDGVRIEVAKELLMNTKLNINAISEEVGFNSNRTFIRVFKKQVGCLPREYRERENTARN